MEQGRMRGRARDVRAAVAMVAALAIALSAGVVRADVEKVERGAAVDLNTASLADLAALPGIGESKARAIVAWRESTPFRSVDELREVKGIGDKMLEKLRPQLTVSQVAAPAAAARPKAAESAASSAASPARAAAQAAQAGKVAESAGR